MSESSNGMAEIGKEFAKETASQGFGLIKSLIKDSPHSRAVDSYITSVEADDSLTREQKAILAWNAKKNIKRAANAISICEMSAEAGVTEQKLLAVDHDWVDYFFEHAAAASQKDLQRIWARILAQECDKPDSVPKALIHTLSIMGKKEADIFMRLASYCIVIHCADGSIQHQPLIYVHEIEKYLMTLEELSALESIGLLQYGSSGLMDNFADEDVIEYFGKEIKAIDLDKRTDIPMGSVLLSHTGEALMRIVGAEEVEGFFEKVVDPMLHCRDAEW